MWRIISCVSSATFRVLINGYSSRPFTSTSGIHQGDPLTPFLFVLVLEGFLALIQRVESQSLWRGILLVLISL